jgi:hypothetical protein
VQLIHSHVQAQSLGRMDIARLVFPEEDDSKRGNEECQDGQLERSDGQSLCESCDAIDCKP